MANKCGHSKSYVKETCTSCFYKDFLPPKTGATTSGTLTTKCDGVENFVFDQDLPTPENVSVTVRGDCGVQVWIYYTDGFTVQRLGWLVQAGQSHTFDTIYSVLKVSLSCAPYSGCKRCNQNADEDVCIVDYDISY